MNNTKTVNLKKQSAGYYTNSAGSISITVSTPAAVCGGKVDWQLIVTVESKIVIDTWFDTKKEACQFATEWLLED